MWHCFGCDEGGDLFKLIAIGEGLLAALDFSRVLELAAAIAGLEQEDDFGGVVALPRPVRPLPPPAEPIEKRLELAKRRGAWVWSRLRDRAGDIAKARGHLLSDAYLERVRRIPVDAVKTREDYRDTPLILSEAERTKRPDLERMSRLFYAPGIALAVRSPHDGAIVDIRVRRFDPKGDQPKIVAMLGGVTSSPAADGNGRGLLGCYGFPHELEKDSIVVVEGLIDYLTALAAFPDCDVLGAVEAGQLSLVAKHAAHALARRSESGRLVLVEHADGMTKDGRPGAGDRSMNEDVNAATKVAVRILGPRRIGWLFCGGSPSDPRYADVKDLNDLWRKSLPMDARNWSDIGDDGARG